MLAENLLSNMHSIACALLSPYLYALVFSHYLFGAVSQSYLRGCLPGCSPNLAPDKTTCTPTLCIFSLVDTDFCIIFKQGEHPYARLGAGVGMIGDSLIFYRFKSFREVWTLKSLGDISLTPPILNARFSFSSQPDQ